MGGKLEEALGKVGTMERERKTGWWGEKEERGGGGGSGGEEVEVGRRGHLEKEKEKE